MEMAHYHQVIAVSAMQVHIRPVMANRIAAFVSQEVFKLKMGKYLLTIAVFVKKENTSHTKVLRPVSYVALACIKLDWVKYH